tara:strand:- start:1178 stop:1960 length:783 start_codon:yes stop_codon:yes gene_type:complete
MNCKNCQTELDHNDEYCKNCGGKVIRNRLTLKNLFEHLSETFFNYDNKLLRTIVQLVKEPEDVIVSYINGVRKKYVNPISFFGLALTLTGLSIFILKKFYMEYLDFSSLFKGSSLSQDMFDSTFSVGLEYNSLIYGALIPLFALISWIVFLDKKYNLTEHVIIYLYSMSFLMVLMFITAQIALLTIPSNYMLVSLFIWPIMFIYHCYILTRIFKLTIGSLILKSMLFFGLFLVSYIGISILAFIIMLATGTINLEDFAPK